MNGKVVTDEFQRACLYMNWVFSQRHSNYWYFSAQYLRKLMRSFNILCNLLFILSWTNYILLHFISKVKRVNFSTAFGLEVVYCLRVIFISREWNNDYLNHIHLFKWEIWSCLSFHINSGNWLMLYWGSAYLHLIFCMISLLKGQFLSNINLKS